MPGRGARRRSKCCFRDNATEQLAAEIKPIAPETIGEESEMPDAHEASGQYVEKEASQELDSVKRHDS